MVGEKTGKKIVVIVMFLLPSLIGVIVFYLLPIIISCIISFTSSDMLINFDFIGFKNFIRVFTDELSLKGLKNVFYYISVYIPVTIVLGIFFSVLLNRNLKGIRFYRTFFFIPVITSWVSVAIIWRWILNGQHGLLNFLLSLIGIQGPVWLQDFFWAMPAIIMVGIWKDVGFVTLILLAGLQTISDDYYEAASLDGANRIQRFFHITMIMLTPSLFFILVISLINSFHLFDQVIIMTNGGPAGSTSTIVEQIYRNAFSNNRLAFASAQSLILFIIILTITLIQNILQRKWVFYE